MQTPATPFTPRAMILGAVSFIVVSLVLIGIVEMVGVDRLREMVANAGPAAPLVYILIKVSTYVFAPLSSGPLQLSSGLLFEPGAAIIYTLIGEVLGGSIGFVIAQRWGRPVVRRFVGESGLGQVDSFMDQVGGWRALLYARLFLFSIYDFISYAAGLTQAVSLKQYILISTIGGLVPTSLFVLAGATLAEDRRLVLIVYALIATLSFVPLVLRWRQHQQP